ncbi:MAG: insulinase family protein, partial [Gammaproteobacteria bacterium]
MKVLVIENDRAPVVVSQVWYKVGGSYEYDGITGVSHVLEHLMFKGTPKHPAGEFSEIIAANGGKENAFTAKDYTAYFQRIANDRLELCLEMEADRMRNLSLDESEFLKELEVVKEERRLRTDDVPTALTYE